MRPRTRDHLDKAARNRRIAIALLDPATTLGVQPPPLDWAVVALFYAAVHYVNAYLWQTRGFASADHRGRQRAVLTAPELRSTAASYLRLRGLADAARYHPRFRPSRSDVEEALRNDLRAVERTIRALLRTRR